MITAPEKTDKSTDSQIKNAVAAAIAIAIARRAESEMRAAITAALEAAGLSAWAEPPQEFHITEDWSNMVTLTAIDTSNIWKTSNRAEINPWMNPDRMEGWRLNVRFVEEPGEPEVVFVPFKKQGKALCGMKPERLAPWENDVWRALAGGVSRGQPKRFQVSYKYERLDDGD